MQQNIQWSDQCQHGKIQPQELQPILELVVRCESEQQFFNRDHGLGSS
jgi:hypothetical protein